MVNVYDEVLIFTPLKDGEFEPIVPDMLEGEEIYTLPGLRTESIGIFNIRNVHTLGKFFSTTVIILAGIITKNGEDRIVLCMIDEPVFESNPEVLVTKILRDHGSWWLTPKIGDLSSD